MGHWLAQWKGSYLLSRDCCYLLLTMNVSLVEGIHNNIFVEVNFDCISLFVFDEKIIMHQSISAVNYSNF